METIKHQKIIRHSVHLFKIALIFMVVYGPFMSAGSDAGEKMEEGMTKEGDLTESQGKYLLREARKTITARLSGKTDALDET
ncbi:MAG TPA: hypothetical protein VKA69_10670, partial [Desulfobacteria bacterium]|nr:hypothetical protein [Desulfobacteria bacterium]